MSPFIVPERAKDEELLADWELHDGHAMYEGPVSSLPVPLKARANTYRL
jgi:hypothetical protein